MSIEIYYDRAIVKVGDKYIPLVNQGSSNSWQMSNSGRNIPAKNWGVLNWHNRSNVLFSLDEIHEIVNDYDSICQESEDAFKTREHSFKEGEFKRWFLNGLKVAYTIEEYVSFGNDLFILDYTSGKLEEWCEYPFSTTAEFLELMKIFKDTSLLSVKFFNSREVYRPKRKKSEIKNFSGSEVYYVLCHNSTNYFCKILKKGYMYTTSILSSDIRTFGTEKDAQKYVEKHPERLKEFRIKKIEKCVEEKIA